jgi:hypothetical protein
MQEEKLLHHEEQEKDTRQAFLEEVLPFLSDPYASQGNEMKGHEGQ